MRSRTLVALLGGLGWLLRRLPDGLMHRLAHVAGGMLHAVQPRRRALVRDNLLRVCTWLAEHELASPRVAAAASDRRALQRLVRDAYSHYVRSYLESLMLERYVRSGLGDRIVADDPALVEACFGFHAADGGRRRALILVGLHFGAIEVPALWATSHGITLTSPMESIDDPALQQFLVRTRGAGGLRLIPTVGAHRELRARLAADEAVAIVADRPVAGVGARVELFGAPARLPLGPAVLALESGAPVWAVAVRRTGPGTYRARLEPIVVPENGRRRERLAALLAAQARAYERLIADAPEQWWTLFFPIWEPGRGAGA